MAKRARPARATKIAFTFAPMGAEPLRIEVEQGATIGEALTAQGYNLTPSDLSGLRVNGQATVPSTKLNAGDFIVLAPKVEGGC